MRIQTYYLISIQIDKNHNFTYEEFKHKYMPFIWDKNKEKDLQLDENYANSMFEHLDNFMSKEIVKVEEMKV